MARDSPYIAQSLYPSEFAMRRFSWFGSPSRLAAVRPRPSARLGVLALEDRVVPTAFRDVGGLRFLTDAVFADSGPTASTTPSLVKVGLTPAAGADFAPLLDLPAGVSVNTNPLTPSATINSTLSARGLTFTGSNLTFGFDTPNKVFKVTGQAAFTVGGTAIGVSFGSPTDATPGLVIRNGKIDSVNTAITGNFSFAGVSIATTDLRLRLDTSATSGTRYAVSGSASASFGGTTDSKTVSFGVAFGQSADKPGLVVENGALKTLAVAVSGGFDIGGVAFTAQNVAFTYKPATAAAGSLFALSGTAGVTVGTGANKVIDNVTLALGSPARPGLVVQSSKLQVLDLTVNGAIKLASVQATGENLHVRYSRDTGVLQFSGKLTVKLADKVQGSIELPDGGLTINTASGAVRLNGFRLGLTANLGVVKLNDAFLAFTANTGGGFDLSGGGTVVLPAGLEVGGSFRISNGKLVQIALSLARDPGLALGNTGVFVSRVDGMLDHLDTPAAISVSGSVTFTAGPSFNLSGRSLSLLQGTATISLDLGARTLKLQGALSLIGTAIPVASGSVTFFYDAVDPRQSSVRATVQVSLYAGFFVGGLDLDLKATGEFSFLAFLKVRLPDITIPQVVFFIPPINIKGIDLATLLVTGKFVPNDPENSFLQFTASVLNNAATFTARVTFAGKLTLTGSVNAGAFGMPAFTTTKNLAALVKNSNPPANPTPLPPVKPPGYFPTIRVLSTERVANSASKDLRVRYQVSTIDTDLKNVSVGFAVNGSGFLKGSSVLGNLNPGETYDKATGVGSLIISTPDAEAFPGQAFTIRGTITDKFETGRSDVVGPIAPGFGPPVLTAPAALAVPAVGTAGLSGASVFDPIAASNPSVRVSVTVEAGAGLALDIPSLVPGADTSTVGEQTAGRVRLNGRARDVNAALALLTVRRTSGSGASSVNIFFSRGVGDPSVLRSVVVPALAPISLVFLPNSPATTVASSPDLYFPLDTTRLVATPGNTVVRAVVLVEAGSRASVDGDTIEFGGASGNLTAVRNATPGFNRLTLITTGQETIRDYAGSIGSIIFRSTTPGSVTLHVILTGSQGDRVEFRRVITVTPAVAPAGPRLASPGGPAAPLAAPALTAAEPVVDVGPGGAAFTGTAPVTVAPELMLDLPDPADPVVTATVSFTGLFDSTADTLSFTPAGDITGTFDATAGVLTLVAGPATTADDFQATLRSVRFTNGRKNPTAYPREVAVVVTTLSGATNQPDLARALVPMVVPTVAPGISGTTAALLFPPGGAPAAVFPDIRLSYPDAALGRPSTPLGAFVPGSHYTRAAVTIAAGYIRGEDFLTFATVGAITGAFDAQRGVLELTGVGTTAEYQRVIASVKYQNRNTSPSTADRTVIVTLDDGSADGAPPTLTRVVQPQSDGLDTARVSGVLNDLTVSPGTAGASLDLGDLTYAPRPGETRLIHTVLDAPQGVQGTVRLADGTTAEAGTEVTIEQLRGATFVPSNTPVAGTVIFRFSTAGVNPVTGVPTETPKVATITITTTNAAPAAATDAASTPAGTAVALQPLANDTDANGDVLVLTSFAQPAHGVVTMADDGSLVYTPFDGFAGIDAFGYTVIDGAGGTATGTATVAVVGAVPPVTPPVTPPAAPPPPPPAVPPVTPPTLIGFREFAAGTDTGAPAAAALYNPDGGVRFTARPFGDFTGGVRVVVADFNGDGVADLVVGTGPGVPTRVVILDGKTQAELFAVEPFEASFTGGVFVAAGDLTGDGVPDLVITPDQGGGPRVRVFAGAGFAVIADFFGIDDPEFRGGARAAVGDITGDGVGDLVVSAGFGGGPRVAGYDGTSLSGGTFTRHAFGDFFAFEDSLRGGVVVTAGDLDGDGYAEVIAGGSPGGGPRVTAYSGKALLGNSRDALANFFSGDDAGRSGIRLAVKNLDGDDRADLVVGAGTGRRVTAYRGQDIARGGTPPAALGLDAFDGPANGVFVG